MSTCTLTDQLLNDRYKIIRPLGKGGMGQTYLAEDTRRPGNPQCVVKQLKPASTDPKFLVTAKRLFNDEAVILEKLGRANDQIPQLLERFEKDGEFYMIQDFVDGHPLSSEMPLGERWSEAQVIQLLQEVLTVLEAVHQAGVIHRDIKPDNLIRRQDGKLCLIDFGAVKQIRTYQAANSQLISMSVAIGTPGYMPTEQAKGRPRPNSDLYALGMVAIQALTGMLPSQLREDDNGEVIWRDQAEVNEGLATVLDKMVRYHFKERFETATEALQALHELTAAKSAQTASNSQQSTQPSVKRPYQPTVEGESAKKAENQKPNPVAQSEAWEEVEEVPIPKTTSAEKASPKAASRPQQNTAKSLDTVSKRERILLGIGAAIATVGLVTGALYVQDRMQQEQTLKTAEKGLTDKKFDECLVQTGSFPSRYTDLYTQSQRLYESCKTGKTQQNTLQDIQKLKADGQYEKVISQAQAFSDTQSVFYPEVQKVLAESQLARARELAGKGSFEAAIKTLAKIAPNSSVQVEVQNLRSEWSEKIFNIAENLYQTGKNPDKDGKDAIAIAKAIPKGSTAYDRAQAKVKEWETAEAQNPNDAALINQSLDGGQCQEAREAANRLNNSPSQSWRNLAQRKLEEITQCERKAATPVEEEGKLAKGEPGVMTREDNNTLFKDFEFVGKSGEAVTIGLRGDFDTKLYLISPDNQEIDINDDINDRNRNSSITKPLNQTGTYRVRVNAYYPADHPKGSGSYHLTVHREAK